MAPPKLYPDILCEIFQHLARARTCKKSENINVITMKDCLFVNRTWARTAAPFVWNDPFTYSLNRSKHVISVYISQLSDDEHKQLGDRGVNIPRNNKNISSSLLFNYPAYIKNLAYDELIITVRKWAEERLVNIGNNSFAIEYIVKSILRLFLKNTVYLRTIEINRQTKIWEEDWSMNLWCQEFLELARRTKILALRGCPESSAVLVPLTISCTNLVSHHISINLTF